MLKCLNFSRRHIVLKFLFLEHGIKLKLQYFEFNMDRKKIQ